jgi:hypothetical protein
MGQGNIKQPEYAIDVITEFHEDFDRALKALKKTMPNVSAESHTLVLLNAMINRAKVPYTLFPED